MMKIITTSFIPKLTKNALKHFQILKKSHHPKKEITARHIVTSQSRQQLYSIAKWKLNKHG